MGAAVALDLVAGVVIDQGLPLLGAFIIGKVSDYVEVAGKKIFEKIQSLTPQGAYATLPSAQKRRKVRPQKGDRLAPALVPLFQGDLSLSLDHPSAEKIRLQVVPVRSVGSLVQVTFIKKIKTMGQGVGTYVISAPSVDTGSLPTDNFFLGRNVLHSRRMADAGNELNHVEEINRIYPFNFVDVFSNQDFHVQIDFDVIYISSLAFWDIVLGDYDIDIESFFTYHPGNFVSTQSKRLFGGGGEVDPGRHYF